MSTKKSSTDICLMQYNGMVPQKGESFEVREGEMGVYAELEIRAWVCPWCNIASKYIVLNGHTIHGGKSTLFSGSKQSDCCGHYSCKAKQRKWHDAPDTKKQVNI